MDEQVERLAGFFRDHAAWQAASRFVGREAESDVYFTHLPEQRYHLEHSEGCAALLEGPARDPDLIFRFSPGSIDRITAVEGGIGDFAVALFSRAVDPDPERHVDIRILSSIAKLTLRGYVGLLLAGGPSVLAFGATHGVSGLSDLRRLVKELRRSEPCDWEQGSLHS